MYEVLQNPKSAEYYVCGKTEKIQISDMNIRENEMLLELE